MHFKNSKPPCCNAVQPNDNRYKKWFDNGGSIEIQDIENGILQLIDENIHTEFTHIGGHSIYRL